MPALGRERTRLVAVVTAQVTDEECAGWTASAGGGIRLTSPRPAPRRSTWSSRCRAACTSRLALPVPHAARGAAGGRADLERLPSRVVIDHLGRVPMEQGVNHPAFTLVRRLLDQGMGGVKLSGAFMDTKVGAAGNKPTPSRSRAATPRPRRRAASEEEGEAGKTGGRGGRAEGDRGRGARDWPHVTGARPGAGRRSAPRPPHRSAPARRRGGAAWKTTRPSARTSRAAPGPRRAGPRSPGRRPGFDGSQPMAVQHDPLPGFVAHGTHP